MTDAIAKVLLYLLAAAAVGVGIFGAAYNAHDGMVFGTFAWLVLGGVIAVVMLGAARS